MIIKTIRAIGDAAARRSAFQATRRELSQLSYRELRDIGLDSGSLMSASYRAGELAVEQRRAKRNAHNAQHQGAVSNQYTLTA